MFSERHIGDILPGLQCLPGLIGLLRREPLGDPKRQVNFPVAITIIKSKPTAGNMRSSLFCRQYAFIAVPGIRLNGPLWADIYLGSKRLLSSTVDSEWLWYSHKQKSSCESNSK
ncbi:UNVERIFIED_ORG: hypothetical protein J3D59_003897 [Pseudomonas fluorescens]